MMVRPSFRFTYRWKRIMPTSVWVPRNAQEAGDPKPASNWQNVTDWTQWYAIDTSQPAASRFWPVGDSSQIETLNTTSLVWIQPSWHFFFTPYDYTALTDDQIQMLEPTLNWSRLYFHHLQDQSPLRTGIWRIEAHRTELQHPSRRPDSFDIFLPELYFTGANSGHACHLVGDLSLILGLYGMTPQLDFIDWEIQNLFFAGNDPKFVLRGNIDNWWPRDWQAEDARALVVQTGYFRDDPQAKDNLKDWQDGKKGPMVSASPLTSSEKQRWGIA